jgi:sortase A
MLKDRDLKYLIIILVIAGTALVARSGYFYAKGILAQYLLNDAWEESMRTKDVVKAWNWADTYPVARLSIPSLNYSKVVLEGINNESLAFGPAHLSLSSSPGEEGNIVIMGHRDSFFRELEDVKIGQTIKLESLSRVQSYTVSDIEVVSPEDTFIIQEASGERITLITCYPFDYIGAAPERYVVRGVSEVDI